MALVEDLFKSNPVTGLAIGVGVLLFGPTLLPAIGQVVRPAVKAAIKGGIVLYDEVAGIGETVGEVVAEARAELAADAGSSAAEPGQTPPAASGSGGRRKRASERLPRTQ